ncbi:MAG: A24 family peptidase, partial [Pseudomonadota bacterium]
MDHPWAFTHLGFGGEAALAVYVIALVMAGVSDFRTLRIPNWLTGALALAFPIAALVAGQPVDWLSHVGASVAVFTVAAVLFAFRLMGGGDVKLLAATALWVGLGQLLPFLVLVAFVGGVFALICVMLRHP